MEIILLERIEKLGQMGDVVRVKSGFARNFLLPQRKALRANKENMACFERQRAELEAINLKRRDEAVAVAEKMDGVRVTLIRQASEGGHLYGSVAARDVQEALRDGGYKVERRQVILHTPLKSLGIYSIALSLHPEVSVNVTVTIARSAAEAEEQHKAAAKEQPAPAEDVFEDSVLEETVEDEETGV